MARVIGKLEYDGELPAKYFIHCTTSGISLGQLFDTVEDAWTGYFDHDIDPPIRPTSAANPQVHLVNKSISTGRQYHYDSLYREPVIGLATVDRLLFPLDDMERYDHDFTILQTETSMHLVANHENTEGHFWSVNEPQPLCEELRKSQDTDRRFRLVEMYGKGVTLCAMCSKIFVNDP